MEGKLFFNYLKKFRHLLNEGVAENSIIDAINNHEWIYLYYVGDDKIARGYRVVRPYVLGTDKRTGKRVLRAWQDNPMNSWHFDNRPTRKDSLKHDYWVDNEGTKPGWRLFRVDRISRIYPTGKKFVDSNGLVMIPAGYHEGGDDDMSSIDVYVSTKNEPNFDYKYDVDYYNATSTTQPSDIEREKWQSIQRGNKYRKQITSTDISTLVNLANRFYKKKKSNFIVVIDSKNNYQLVTQKQIDFAKKKYGIDIPDYAIVGNLSDLYNKYIERNIKQQISEELLRDNRFIAKKNVFEFWVGNDLFFKLKYNIESPNELFNEKYVSIYDLVAFESFGCEGYASKLLDNIFDYVKKNLGINIITLIVYKNNYDAISLYLKKGFILISEFDDNYSMVKFL